jgi:hypothetical protein
MAESGDSSYLAGIPGSVVVRAQEDLDFAMRLLHRETRAEALGEPGLGLGPQERAEVFEVLDAIAAMTFQEVIEHLRGVGVVRLG